MLVKLSAICLLRYAVSGTKHSLQQNTFIAVQPAVNVTDQRKSQDKRCMKLLHGFFINA